MLLGWFAVLFSLGYKPYFGGLCLAKIPSLSVLLGLRWRIAGVLEPGDRVVLGTDIYC